MSLTREEKQNICAKFGKGPQDTGSSEVQVALLTKNIAVLTIHCKNNPKDFSTRRGLLQMVSDRKSHLQYVQKKNMNKYKELVAELGLRK